MSTINKNLKITQSNYFMGVELDPYEKKYVIDYLSKFIAVLNHAISLTGKIYMVRIDLRIPRYFCCEYIDQSNEVIRKFNRSLKSKLKARDERKRREGNRVYPHNLHYVWVREQAEAEHWHYHAILMLNGYAYNDIGPYDGSYPDCLAYIIQDAWSSALGIFLHETFPLVDFPRDSRFYLNPVESETAAAIKRGSYLFKARTKQHGCGHRLFGTSNINPYGCDDD